MTTRESRWTSLAMLAIAAVTLALTLGEGGAKAIAERARQAKQVADTQAEVQDLATKFDGHEKRLTVLEADNDLRRDTKKELDEIKGLLLAQGRKHG